jgi:radical SAM-linked protein
MNRQRLRIRFRKEGDLRLISHRDLARTLERQFRRADLPLAMSEGFHPHPRMTFASALALGIEGADEVVDVFLDQPVTESLAEQRLREQSPPGLVITSVQVLDPQDPKPRVDRVRYQIRVPAARQPAARQAIEQLLQQTACPLARSGGRTPIDVRPAIEELRLEGDRLQIALRVDAQSPVQPRQILGLLGLDDLEFQGASLVRTQVELVQKASTTPGTTSVMQCRGNDWSLDRPSFGMQRDQDEERDTDQRRPTGRVPDRDR